MDKNSIYKKALEREKGKVTRISLKFMNSTDNDIVTYLKDKPKQETIKKAIRYYMKKENNGGNENENETN